MSHLCSNQPVPAGPPWVGHAFPVCPGSPPGACCPAWGAASWAARASWCRMDNHDYQSSLDQKWADCYFVCGQSCSANLSWAPAARLSPPLSCLSSMVTLSAPPSPLLSWGHEPQSPGQPQLSLPCPAVLSHQSVLILPMVFFALLGFLSEDK